ncbi:AGE family epimerase/isomerase [Chitinimonas sp. BJYL2]|uniref:AGE family epimerase/isomerase n=1 Tax=Chitinimonas sp. BJYL2 TaxID=2976696 RepID=UPI0022B5CF83|nr:AGE family epimerase/isomerase [Chitinimonas sp. BJYL2]
MNLPDFLSVSTLENHIRHTLAFYDPRCLDPAGGFFHFYMDDGEIYDRTQRHLVSSTRFVFNYARAAVHFGRPDYRDWARHGLDFLQSAHYQPATGGYAWLLDAGKVVDATNHCYGAAFVLLAHAEALKAGIGDARTGLESAYQLLEQRFWLPEHGLFADEYNADFSVLAPYRGQNANMHACEAHIAAYQATGEDRYLERALTIAEGITGRLADPKSGMVWEHYDPNWQIDWQYNLDDPKHLFRPWGFQPGHQTEWAKLLVTLHRLRPNPALVDRAARLFNTAVELAWDHEHGGLVYGIAPDGTVCDDDKYFWVQAESFAAAALLAEAAGETPAVPGHYFRWYERIWAYSWEHMVDHQYGAWYRILNRRNEKYSREKSPAGKTDYHTMGACYEVIDVLKRMGG